MRFQTAPRWICKRGRFLVLVGARPSSLKSTSARLREARTLPDEPRRKKSEAESWFASLLWNPLFPHHNLKVHQLLALGVVNPFHVDMRAGQGRVNPFHIEEEKSRLRGVGLDGFGGELRGLDLVAFFLGDGPLHLFLRDGKRQWGVGVGAGIGNA